MTARPTAATSRPARPRLLRPSRLLAAAREWAAAHPLEVGFIAAGLLARLVFWLVTDRRFEDGLTTIAHARNAADGMGLTYHPFDEATHGFTSAISVLVPLVGELLSFIPGVDGLLAIRLASLLAFVATIVAASSIAEHMGLGRWAKVLPYGFLAFSFNHIYYGMAGMETQLGVAILLWTIVAGLRRRPIAAGVLYGLCLLARPDFVLFVGVALAWWLLQDRRAALRAGLIAGVTVLPWVVFTTLYYGSPVPNTIPAKALRFYVDWPNSLAPGAWWDFVSTQVDARQAWLWRTMSPLWEHWFVLNLSVSPTFAKLFSGALIALVVGGAIALWRSAPALRPAIVFAAIFVVYRMLALPDQYYDWYYPPLTALAVLFAGYAVHRLAAVAPLIPVVTGVVVTGAFFAALLPLIVLDARYQHDIEDRARVPLGRYLGDHVPRGSVVTSESAGYVGYYSHGNIELWDYPGLTSKKALSIMEALGRKRSNVEALGDAARPDYAVWRPIELAAFEKYYPDSARLYEEVARFKTPFTEDRLVWHGVRYVVHDEEFILMKRVRGQLGGVERARRLAASE